MSPVTLPAGTEHGTPEGHEAGCKGDRAGCPALHTHGMTCTSAYVRAATTPDRYYKAKARDPRPAAIARTLGFKPTPTGDRLAAAAEDERFEQRRAEMKSRRPAPKPAQPLAERAHDSAPQEDAATPAIEEEAPAERTPAAEAEAMGHTTTPEETPAMTATDDAPASVEASAVSSTVSESVGHLTLADFTKGLTQAARTTRGRQIREWCRENGYPNVPAKGIIPSDALAAYAAAHPGEAGAIAAPPAPAKLKPKPKRTTASPIPRPVIKGLVDVEDVAHLSDLLDETRHRIGDPLLTEPARIELLVPTEAEQDRPEWGDVAVASDVEHAREIAARLFLELTDAEAARDQAQSALELTLQKWGAATSRNIVLELQLALSRVALLSAQSAQLTSARKALWQKGFAEQWRARANEMTEVTRERDRLRDLIEAAATATPRRLRRIRRSAQTR